MDRKQLEVCLVPFKEACLIHGRPLEDICVFEAYPGDVSTSFIVQVKADWIENMNCADAIDFLFDTLWETIDEPMRKFIFSIEILDSKDELYCYHETADTKKIADTI